MKVWDVEGVTAGYDGHTSFESFRGFRSVRVACHVSNYLDHSNTGKRPGRVRSASER